MQESQYTENITTAEEFSIGEDLDMLGQEEEMLEEESFVMSGEVSPEELELSSQPPFNFEAHFSGLMGMAADRQTVAAYLDAHEGWFCRCAQPMTAEPFGENGYILTVGRFKSFGYEVEPKMAVVLLPPQDGLYVMHSVEVPDYTPPGYEVSYTSSLTLEEVSGWEIDWNTSDGDIATRVEWQLHLLVAIQ
ncbi:MAG: DUF1997 domain-containing protein, partial [Cyanobacteria bacterium P01_E01_bin.42]